MSANPAQHADPASDLPLPPAGEPRDAARRYLELLGALAPTRSLLDVRYRVRGHGLARFFVSPRSPNVAATLVRIGRHTDVYVGCAPRARRAGGRRDVAATALVWADCDNLQATERLRSFTPRPTLLVASGTPDHVHAYWALTVTLDVPELEDANRRIAAALGADQGAVTNAAAILRVPGTHNFKHTPAQPVVVLDASGSRYHPSEITRSLPPSPPRQATQARPATDAHADPLLAIDPAQYVHVLTGCDPGRDRKIACPFHADRTPSLHVYATPERGWYCYGRCQRGGTIYDLAGALWAIPTTGRSFLDLRQRLDELFQVRRD